MMGNDSSTEVVDSCISESEPIMPPRFFTNILQIGQRSLQNTVETIQSPLRWAKSSMEYLHAAIKSSRRNRNSTNQDEDLGIPMRILFGCDETGIDASAFFGGHDTEISETGEPYHYTPLKTFQSSLTSINEQLLSSTVVVSSFNHGGIHSVTESPESLHILEEKDVLTKYFDEEEVKRKEYEKFLQETTHQAEEKFTREKELAKEEFVSSMTNIISKQQEGNEQFNTWLENVD